jgi:type IV secretion system protein VirB10
MTDSPSPAADSAAAVASDRGISPIAGRFAVSRSGKALAFAGLVAGCGAFALATSHAQGPKTAKVAAPPAKQVVPYEPAPTLANPGPDAPALAPASPTPAVGPTAPAAVTAPSGPNPVQAIRAAPIMAFSGSGAAAADATQVPSIARLAAAMGGDAPTELEQLRRGSAIGTVRARQLGDRSFLLLAGTTIPCVLQTAMDSTTPGYVSCVVPSDVYSENGATVLLEKGSKVIGEYRSSLKAGQARLFVLWTRAVTPNGVALELASPATDALGRAGFDGDLDRHFWERFGGALLLSVVDDGTAALAPRNGAALETPRAPSDAAGIAVAHSIDIPPTLKKAQGSEVAIFAAQDFDFSGVYGLKAR